MRKGNKCWQLYAGWVIIFFSSYGCTSSNKKNTEAIKPLPATIATGKQLFITHCASCHKINQEMTGPALKGAEARWPDQKKLYAFIRNSSEVIRNDKYARELWLQYNQTLMQAQPGLSDTDIRAVLDYINSVAEQ